MHAHTHVHTHFSAVVENQACTAKSLGELARIARAWIPQPDVCLLVENDCPVLAAAVFEQCLSYVSPTSFSPCRQSTDTLNHYISGKVLSTLNLYYPTDSLLQPFHTDTISISILLVREGRLVEAEWLAEDHTSRREARIQAVIDVLTTWSCPPLHCLSDH